MMGPELNYLISFNNSKILVFNSTYGQIEKKKSKKCHTIKRINIINVSVWQILRFSNSQICCHFQPHALSNNNICKSEWTVTDYFHTRQNIKKIFFPLLTKLTLFVPLRIYRCCLSIHLDSIPHADTPAHHKDNLTQTALAAGWRSVVVIKGRPVGVIGLTQVKTKT